MRTKYLFLTTQFHHMSKKNIKSVQIYGVHLYTAGHTNWKLNYAVKVITLTWKIFHVGEVGHVAGRSAHARLKLETYQSVES